MNDMQVRVWNVGAAGGPTPVAEQQCAAPVLDLAWAPVRRTHAFHSLHRRQDGSKIFTATADGEGKMWDVATSEYVQVAKVGVCGGRMSLTAAARRPDQNVPLDPNQERAHDGRLRQEHPRLLHHTPPHH